LAQPSPRTGLFAAAFCLAIAATFFFGYRAGHNAHHIRWQEEPIQPWMSVPFIAHTRHTREEILFQAIHVPPNRRDHRPVRDIARAEKLPVDELIRDLQRAAAAANSPGSDAAAPPGKPAR
jgi:hypothetical protein